MRRRGRAARTPCAGGDGCVNVHGRHYRTIWREASDRARVRAIDQNALPHRFEVVDLRSAEDACRAIADMTVRGAGLIGATAAYGMALAALAATAGEHRATLAAAGAALKATRPTAANLGWAVDRMQAACAGIATRKAAVAAALREADGIADQDVECCRRIGAHGLGLIREAHARRPNRPVQILTHCNAGWLAFVDIGTATGPIYAAQAEGIPVHVWVDETRPRNQGARLTAWELGAQGVPHTLIADNAGGHLMQCGEVDLVLTGADRVSRRGDVANKIGTYLKALAARDNGIPFHVAVPRSSFDFDVADGRAEIPIEERDPAEVRCVEGLAPDGCETSVCICPEGTPARNWGFDVTPARLVTGLITERGLCAASEPDIVALFPEARR